MCIHSCQSCPLLCDPMDCSPPGSSVHGNLQAGRRVGCHALLQGICPTDRERTLISCVSCIGRRVLYRWATREAPLQDTLHKILTFCTSDPLTTLTPLLVPTAYFLVCLNELSCLWHQVGCDQRGTSRRSCVQFSHLVMSDPLRPHEPQHTRPPCPSPTAEVYPNPCRRRGENQGECVFPRLASAVLLPARTLDCDLPCSLPGFLNSASVWLFTPRVVPELASSQNPSLLPSCFCAGPSPTHTLFQTFLYRTLLIRQGRVPQTLPDK